MPSLSTPPLSMGRVHLAALTAIICFTLVACGGGSGGDSPAPGDPPAGPPAPAPAPATVALSAAAETVAQTAGSVVITVNRAGGTDAASVGYGTHDGTAVAGSDYTASTGTLTWSAGDSSAKSLNIPLSAAAFSGSKAFTVSLSGAQGATVGTPSAATVTINGSGAPATAGTVALSAAAGSVAQTAGSITITVNRSGGSSGAAHVNYATQDGTAVAGSQYTAASGVLNWNSGDGGAKTVAISIGQYRFFGRQELQGRVVERRRRRSRHSRERDGDINGSGTAGGGGSGSGPAAALAAKLGMPSRLLIGVWGGQAQGDPIGMVRTQGVKIDIYERYLGTGDWTSWNAPPCDYVCVVSTAADSVGAIPMFTSTRWRTMGMAIYRWSATRRSWPLIGRGKAIVSGLGDVQQARPS